MIERYFEGQGALTRLRTPTISFFVHSLSYISMARDAENVAYRFGKRPWGFFAPGSPSEASQRGQSCFPTAMALG